MRVPIEQTSIYPLNGKPPVRGKRTGGKVLTKEQKPMTNMQARGSDFNNLLGQSLAKDTVSIDARVQVVTPAWAKEKTEVWHYEWQRPLSRTNLSRLVTEMECGRFVPGTPVFICQTPDGARFIVNGQHTLTAVIQSGIPIPLTVITLKVPDMEAVGKIYGRFDVHGVRTYGQSWKAFKQEEITALESRSIAGIAIILSDFQVHSNSLPSREDRLVNLKEYMDYGTLEVLANALDAGGRKGTEDVSGKAKRAAIIAVALYTTRHQPSAALEFWRNVVTEGHPDRNHASRTLAIYLRKHRGAGSASQFSDLNAASVAWNRAWTDDRPSHFKVAKTFHLLGTPWHKGNPNES